MHKLTLAVINDGATYQRRLVTANAWLDEKWSSDCVMAQFFDLVAREAKSPVYEGEVFTRDEKWESAGEVFDYMTRHAAECRGL